MKVEYRFSDCYLLWYVSFLRKLLEDVLNDKGINQESGRHAGNRTTSREAQEPQDEPVYLA